MTALVPRSYLHGSLNRSVRLFLLLVRIKSPKCLINTPLCECFMSHTSAKCLFNLVSQQLRGRILHWQHCFGETNSTNVTLQETSDWDNKKHVNLTMNDCSNYALLVEMPNDARHPLFNLIRYISQNAKNARLYAHTL